ncbi:MAG: insulinase family protein [Candidatus Eremiobacteraeota bacterium]|nr:insulinase family protein [Candidatus Eremiobacteraeota bacterium]
MSAFRTSLRAAVSAALLVSGTTASALAQSAPTTTPSGDGRLPSGVVYEVRPDPAQSAAAVALWYRAPAGGFDGTAVPGFSRLAAATVAASTPITGTPLGQLVDRFGGRLTVVAYPDSLAITALVPPDRVAQTVRAMTADYFAPVVSAQGLQVAQRDSGDDLLYRSVGPEAIEDALGAALFTAGPLHDGTIGSSESLAGARVDRIRAFAERAFRPSNAVLILTGNVDPAVLSDVASRVGPAPDPSPEPATTQTARAPAGPLHREGNIAGTGLGWIGPPIADEASATALDFVADALFTPKTGTVAKALGNRKATVTGKFVTYHDPGVFLVTITGDDAEAALPIVERAITDATKPMAPDAFDAARAAFVYRLLGDMATPAELADTYGWYTIEGDAAYAPSEGGTQGRYFGLTAKLTPASVAQVAAKYLGTAPAIVTLTKAAPRPTGSHA